MADQKKDRIEIEEITDEELEDVAGGTCSGCGSCAAKPEVPSTPPN